jgi:hypothetical protein
LTDFAVELRHYCRNPKCRMKLPKPADNPREAFCTRGCHGSFYLHRCLVCEGRLVRKNATQKVCRKSKCRNAFRGSSVKGRYLPQSAAREAPKTPDFIDSKQAPKPDRATLIRNAMQAEFFGGGKWREVISPDGVRCCVTRLWGA